MVSSTMRSYNGEVDHQRVQLRLTNMLDRDGS